VFEKQPSTGCRPGVLIVPFRWEHWDDLWLLRKQQLAEHGIVVEGPPDRPDPTSPYEQDYHRMDQIYLRTRGGFWLARRDDVPVGHVGLEDRGDHLELRRMYVSGQYRRQGIGSMLVRTAVDHCTRPGVSNIELWTAADGPGHRLYEKHGFRRVNPSAQDASHTHEDVTEIRMRLTLPGVTRVPRSDSMGSR
jgi:GNAT superfamily N-acetyltransferase